MNIYQPQSGDIYEPVDRAQKFREQQNALARQQAVRNALAQSIDPRTGRTNWQQAYAMGGANVAPDIQGLQQADMLAQAKLAHERGLGQKAGIDAETAYWTQQRDVASRIGDQASWSSWRSTLPAEFQQYVPEKFTPDNKRMTLATADKALELHFQQVDTGEGGYTLAMPSIGGPATKVPGSEFRATLSPDERSRIDREFNPNKVAHVTTDEQGNNHFFNSAGIEISVGAGQGTGKPSAQVTKDRIARRDLESNINSTITELEAALKPNGLLSRATGSGFGSAIDKASAAVGRATEGSVAIGQLQPIFDMVLKLVPRFEGPQSDADTRSYREAAGNLANPSTPNPVKKAAATTILRLMKLRRNQFGVKDETGNVVTGEQPAAGGDDLDALVERHRTK